MSAGDVAFLLHQLSVDDYFDDDTFDAVVNDDSSRCEINIQDLAESAARHIEKLEAENAALKEENERLKEYKDIALEFDRHRMKAIYLLKMISDGFACAEDCAAFLSLHSPSAMEITVSLSHLEVENSKLREINASLEAIIHHDNIWKHKASLEIDSLKAEVARLEGTYVPVARLEQVYEEDEIQHSGDSNDFIVEWLTGRNFKQGETLYIKEPANEG